jgi:hypothetical protein
MDATTKTPLLKPRPFLLGGVLFEVQAMAESRRIESDLIADLGGD